MRKPKTKCKKAISKNRFKALVFEVMNERIEKGKGDPLMNILIAGMLIGANENH